MKNQKWYKKTWFAIAMGIVAVLFIFALIAPKGKNASTATNANVSSTESGGSKSGTSSKSGKQGSGTANAGVTGKLRVSYIDVGQGDSILIQQGSRNMLIDAGTNAAEEAVVNYIQKQGISKIDYLVLTHPHEDHIGGADKVIETFSIGTVYMPKVTDTTQTFKSVVAAMNSKNLKAVTPQIGSSFKLGEASCMILGPVNTQKNDLNTYSIVLKITFGNTKFLFTGDAQSSNEEAMINRGYDLTADVLKVGHHGSHTSTSQEFLNKVKPEYAVISVGKGNDYGHPHKQTMDRLKAAGIKVYRTDENGTVVCTSDGSKISFSCSTGDYAYGSNPSPGSESSGESGNSSQLSPSPAQVPAVTNADYQYIGDSATRKFHKLTCRYAAKISSSHKVLFKTREEAINAGYVPCKECNP